MYTHHAYIMTESFVDISEIVCCGNEIDTVSTDSRYNKAYIKYN